MGKVGRYTGFGFRGAKGDYNTTMLEFLFGSRNPTRGGWPVAKGDRLTLDLDGSTLNHVRLGQPLTQLSFLGPDESRTAKCDGELCYFSQGLAIRFDPDRNTIVEYRIVQSDPLEHQFQPFRGTVIIKGPACSTCGPKR